MEIEIKQISSLEKVFLDSTTDFKETERATALKGERFSYQIAFKLSEYGNSFADIDVAVESKLEKYINVYNVENIPGELTYYREMFGGSDDDYLVKGAGLFPELLVPCNGIIKIKENMWKALWFEIVIPEDVLPGNYEIRTNFFNKDENLSFSKTFNIEIVDAVLPKQELKYTNWFHADCLYTYYNIEPLSDRHFEIIYNFMKTAADYGMNTILTPVFTPPLDVDVGGERPTIQLVEILYSNGKYSFDFKNLKKWIDLAHKAGIENFEIAHFFTQWGAEYTPKIIVNGEKKFGWHVKATDPNYKEFLSQFVPALIAFLKDEGIKDNTFFHVSDEPSHNNLENYQKAKKILSEYAEDVPSMDALSHYELYKEKAVENPIVATDCIDKFIEKGVKNLWAYYCCAQPVNVSNRYFSMPSARNRVLGVQLYKYDIEGFLHWGYNFYYAARSRCFINPYLVTDAGGSFPSGDSFIVYPGADGKALKSLRLLVFNEGLQDLRALTLAEKLAGRDTVLKLIEENGEIKFAKYPKGASYLLELRTKINELIKQSI